MKERINQELKLLKQGFPVLQYMEEVGWILIPKYKLPINIWNREYTKVCFQIPVDYPGSPPYSFYVESGIKTKDSNEKPDNYDEPVQIPFDGEWGKFSWQHDASWRATSDLTMGSNLLNFVRSFQDRLKQGK